jgi:DNA-binding FadR family transcriptional regulator
MTAATGGSIVRVPKAGEMIAAQLRRQIVLGELAQGVVLPSESVLMERFGVSRPTLREAFRILEAESVISVRRGARGGATVMAPNDGVAARYTGFLLQHRGALLADVYRARTTLEVSAVEMLATRRGKAHITELTSLVEHGVTLLDGGDPYAEHDSVFHQTVVRLAGNETLTMLISMLYAIIEEHNHKFVARNSKAVMGPTARMAQRAHEGLIELLAARDGVAAQEFWQRHLETVADYMVTDPTTTVVEVLT